MMLILKTGTHIQFQDRSEAAGVVSRMLLELEQGGMDAVRRYSRELDHWDPPSFELGRAQIREATESLPAQLRADTEYCQANVRAFAEAQLATLAPLEVEIRPGVTLGHRHIPINRVGTYVPGGRYPMFGSAQMNIIPARVAGVGTVLACTPPIRGGGFYAPTVHAMHAAGADRIFILGGVPAFALMVFGMGVVEPVDMVCGAGNQYVAEAKRQLFGRVGIDLLAGPTEILILADGSVDAELVACDLLGQAEHDPNSSVCLIDTDEGHARAVLAEVERQLAVLPTREIAGPAWRDHGMIYVAEDSAEAIRLSDEYAPEHLELLVRDTEFFEERLTNYGSLFIGPETTVAYGDKTIGTNHVLPTSRSARYTGGLWVGKFLKTCTYQRCTPAASVEIGEVCARQCRAEQMIGHALTAEMRVQRHGLAAVS